MATHSVPTVAGIFQTADIINFKIRLSICSPKWTDTSGASSFVAWFFFFLPSPTWRTWSSLQVPCRGRCWALPGASYCEEFLRQYTCWLLRSHSSQQPAKTLPEKHPQEPLPVVCRCSFHQQRPNCWWLVASSASVDAAASHVWLCGGAASKASCLKLPLRWTDP